MLIFILGAGYGAWHTLLAIFAFGVAITMALVVHEWAHAWAANKSGDPTAKMMGRMSLNPRRHVEPVGLVSFMLVGIGWAKPVPVNPFNYRNFKWGNFFVSISGIVVNLILAIVFSLCLYFMDTYAHVSLHGNIGIWALYQFFMMATFLNVALMIFNLLPIFPLDGYNILRSFTKPNNSYMQFVRNNTHWLLITVILVIMVTGWFGMLRDSIIGAFLWFWGLIF